MSQRELSLKFKNKNYKLVEEYNKRNYADREQKKNIFEGHVEHYK